MPHVIESLSGLANFSIYFFTALALLLAFKFIYVLITPYDEWKLVKEDKNTAAATGFAGAFIGFAIALSGAATNSVSVIDYIIWGVVGLVAQMIAFAMVRFIFMPKIVARIQDNELSAGIILGSVSIAVGILNAACMSY